MRLLQFKLVLYVWMRWVPFWYKYVQVCVCVCKMWNSTPWHVIYISHIYFTDRNSICVGHKFKCTTTEIKFSLIWQNCKDFALHWNWIAILVLQSHSYSVNRGCMRVEMYTHCTHRGHLHIFRIKYALWTCHKYTHTHTCTYKLLLPQLRQDTISHISACS